MELLIVAHHIMRGKLANPTLFPVNAYQLEAMIDVLERQCLLTGKEVLDEMEVVAATKRKTTKWQ